jgi:hypothetical protein
MYLAGWISCPHCLFRWQVCVEVDEDPDPDQLIVVHCPNDDSQHRFTLALLQTVAECPPGVTPMRLEEPEPPDRPRRWWRFWEWGRG